MSPSMRDMIRMTARTNGITIASVAAHFLNAANIANDDPAAVANAILNIKRGITLCADIGAGVLLVPFFYDAEIVGEAGIERLVRALKTLAPDAEKAGVVLGIESTLPAAANLAVVAAVGSKNVGIYWDMANGMAVGYDPVADAKALAGVIVQVHAKEFVRDAGPVGSRSAPRFDMLNHKALGHGDVPLAAIISALRSGGYTGHVVCETGTFGTVSASAAADLATLRAAS
jgi:sugar phosphate isomerase/epimerase